MINHIITGENLNQFAYTNEEYCSKPIRGVVLEFHGLGFDGFIKERSPFASKCAQLGILYIFPYYGPWSWMNDTAVHYTDDIIDAIFEKYNLDSNIPIISTGGSMGGLSALIYTRYSKRTPRACAANCPVCDLPFHLAEREDLPRTLYSAFEHYDQDFMGALESASPIHQVKSMPRIPYYVVHGDADTAVNKFKHSDVFVCKMKKENYSIIYNEVPNMTHCDLKGEELKKYWDFIFSIIN
ncbi:MAG TPA: prolyl oligopeptidase family serine peptidase [Clostridiaceae bacterium]